VKSFIRISPINSISAINYIVLLRGRSKFQVTKASLAGLKIKANFANRPITMFCYYNVRNIFTFRFRVIDVVTINKHDNVRILLKATAFTKVRQLWYLRLAGLHSA